MELETMIRNLIFETVMESEYSFRCREPIVGFADAKNPLYEQLSEIIGNPQLLPTDLLPAAKTVLVFFLPFSEKIIDAIIKDKIIVQEWSDTYTDTNLLLKRISDNIIKKLDKMGIQAVSEPPTNNYDPSSLTAKWAHKSSAFIAGIGTFGLNRLLITKSGTAGRLNSIVMDAKINPTKRPDIEYCLFKKSGKCRVCVDKCPSGALSEQGFDRFRCNAYLDGKNIHSSQQGCPMCSSGPCAKRGFE